MIDIIFYILFYDILFYITHVYLHKKEYYYIHKLHHEIEYKKLSYIDTIKGDTLENIIQPLGILIPLIFFNFNIINFIYAILFIQIRGLMRHDHNYVWLIGNHHLLHHKNMNYNYGEYWIDYLCETRYPYEEDYKYGLIYI